MTRVADRDSGIEAGAGNTSGVAPMASPFAGRYLRYGQPFRRPHAHRSELRATAPNGDVEPQRSSLDLPPFGACRAATMPAIAPTFGNGFCLARIALAGPGTASGSIAMFRFTRLPRHPLSPRTPPRAQARAHDRGVVTHLIPHPSISEYEKISERMDTPNPAVRGAEYAQSRSISAHSLPCREPFKGWRIMGKSNAIVRFFGDYQRRLRRTSLMRLARSSKPLTAHTGKSAE